MVTVCGGSARFNARLDVWLTTAPSSAVATRLSRERLLLPDALRRVLSRRRGERARFIRLRRSDIVSTPISLPLLPSSHSCLRALFLPYYATAGAAEKGLFWRGNCSPPGELWSVCRLTRRAFGSVRDAWCALDYLPAPGCRVSSFIRTSCWFVPYSRVPPPDVLLHRSGVSS